MADKKNLVIKVKYPVAGTKAKDDIPAPLTTTEWNIKRLALVAVILTLVLGILFYYLIQDEVEQETDLQSVSPAAENNIAKPEPTPVAIDSAKSPGNQPAMLADVNKTQPSAKTPETQQTQNILPKDTPAGQTAMDQQAGTVAGESKTAPVNVTVSRALLTYEVKSTEPMTEIPRTVHVNKAKSTVVYYFTEVEGMSGRPIFHEWLRNGKVVTRYKLNVADNNWRTYSNMSLSTKGLGNWTVRLLADNNQLLSQQTFKVVMK